MKMVRTWYVANQVETVQQFYSRHWHKSGFSTRIVCDKLIQRLVKFKEHAGIFCAQ
jgi:hypothetical protein